MNHQVRQALCELIARHGRSLCSEPKRCKGLLLDHCPGDRREVFVLISALEEQVVSNLLDGATGRTWTLVAARLSSRLVERRAMTDEAALWAVESWALALGVISEITPASGLQLEPLTKPTEFTTEPVRHVHEPGAGEPGKGRPVPGIVTTLVGQVRLRLIQAGEFWMGSPAGDAEACSDEKPSHKVRISQPFYLGLTPVTQAQYEAVTGRNPSRFQGEPDNPVEGVSWFNAAAFCNGLSKNDNLPLYYVFRGFSEVHAVGGPGYRLPTETEWEYACRAGTRTRYYCGDDIERLGEYAWYAANSGGQTRPVRRNRPNAWGLYDMHGNVWEWCGNFYDTTYRAMRGGSWMDGPALLRAACRCGRGPYDQVGILGFRVARGTSSR